MHARHHDDTTPPYTPLHPLHPLTPPCTPPPPRSTPSYPLTPLPPSPLPDQVVPKDEATKARIKATVGGNLLFKGLDREQLEAVVMSMEEITISQGEAVITQGEEGNHFYVVDRCRM